MYMQIPDKKLCANKDKTVNYLLIEALLKDGFIADTCHFNLEHISNRGSKILGQLVFDCFITLLKPTQAGHDKHLCVYK